MRYIRLKALTWWAGAFAIALGLLKASGYPATWAASTWSADPRVEGILSALAETLAALTGGDTSPAGLILLGMGLIGIRDKLERGTAVDFGFLDGPGLDVVAEEHDDDLDDGGGDAGFDDMGADLAGAYDNDLPPGVVDPFGPGGSRS